MSWLKRSFLSIRKFEDIKRDIDLDILFLLETKNPNEFVRKKLEQLSFDYFEIVSPVGHAARGLALLWKERVKVEIIDANANLIDKVMEYEGKSFFFSFVYADTDYIKQRDL